MSVKLQITQVFRVVRQIVIDVESEDAIEQFYEGEIETPSTTDPRWREIDRSLENETARCVD